ncbi:hypothetical protein, partial [Xanthovirga aplysinae]|uniref:hypothetical protein n=1 Tax=Xanthovirga aplysinae TaxID=2529853 RepID=UPI001656ED98
LDEINLIEGNNNSNNSQKASTDQDGFSLFSTNNIIRSSNIMEGSRNDYNSQELDGDQDGDDHLIDDVNLILGNN